MDVAKHDDGYVAANRWGIEYFVLDRNGNPVSISRIFTSGQAEFLDIENGLAAVSNFTGSVEFFRIENGKFSRAGWLELDFHPLELKIIGQYLYIGGAEKSLTVYDITDPFHAVFVTETIFDGYPHDFKMRNDTLFVAAYHGGVVLLDISDRSNPALLEQYFMPDYVYGVEIESSYVYVCAHQSGLYVLDIRYSDNPPVIGHNPNFGSAREAQIIEEGLLVLDGFGFMRLIDKTNPSRPEEIWNFPLQFNCYNMEITGETVFVANWLYGVKIVDLRGKEGATLISQAEQYSICKSLALDNGHVLAAADKGGLLVFDGDLKPLTVPDLEIEGSCMEIKIRGGKGFVSNDEYGLTVLDLKKNGDITNISGIKTSGWVRSSTYNGQFVFLANWQGIVTIDLADINEPFEDGFYDTYFGSAKIEFRNDTVFVAGSGGLELYDASDPRNVVFLSRYSTEYPALGLSFDRELAVLSSGLGGVDFIGFYGGSVPIAHISTAGKAYDADIIGNKLFVAEEDSGVTVWDVSVVDHPELMLRYDVAGKAFDLAYQGNLVYVADYYGVTMLELPWEDIYPDDSDEHSEPIRFLTLYPNPVFGRASVLLDTGVPGLINVELYDILGRKVRTLYEGYSRGNSVINWEKESLPSGCYYVRVRGDGFSETRQVTLLR